MLQKTPKPPSNRTNIGLWLLAIGLILILLSGLLRVLGMLAHADKLDEAKYAHSCTKNPGWVYVKPFYRDPTMVWCKRPENGEMGIFQVEKD